MLGMNREIFNKNQECLILIPEIVNLFRRQFYFKGNKRLVSLMSQLNDISETVVTQNQPEMSQEEWIETLRAILEAQRNRDYILLADILEGDLLPYLQKLQMALQAAVRIEQPTFWQQNVNAVRTVDNILYQSLLQYDWHNTSEKYQLVTAINGQVSLKAGGLRGEICMHSMVNPQWDAEVFADSILEQGNFHYIVFGMGLGYHIRALLERDSRNKVTVLVNELEILYYAFTYLDWSLYLREERLQIVYEADTAKLLSSLKQDRGKSVFAIHYPSVRCVENENIRETLEDYFVSMSSMREQQQLLDTNFEQLQKMKLPECEEVSHIFDGKILVLVGGGPSVDNEMESIKKYRSRISLVVVGTVARKFIEAGIRPDAIVISDPQEHMKRQIQGLDTQGIPLLLLCTASAEIVPCYEGDVYIVYQQGYEKAERLALREGYRCFQTGGSVSTLALDMGISMGAGKVILVGMDMAYTGLRSHAGGIGREIKDDTELRRVIGTDGNYVYTSKNLDIYRKWIERRIAGLKHPVIYNTAKGARIAGTVEMIFEKIMLM